MAGFSGLALASAAACANSTTSPSTTNGTPVSIVGGASALTTTAYAPNPISIVVGGTITWTNNDTTSHTSTGMNGTWESGSIAPGSSQQDVSNAGTFPYLCTIHPGMVGTATVQ
jgi:plastocyanin